MQKKVEALAERVDRNIYADNRWWRECKYEETTSHTERIVSPYARCTAGVPYIVENSRRTYSFCPMMAVTGRQERPPGRGTPNPGMDVINSKAKKQSFTFCFDKVFELSFRTLDAFLVYINTCTPSRLKHPHDVTVNYCGFASTSQNLVPHLENHYQPKLHLSHGRPEPTWIFRPV